MAVALYMDQHIPRSVTTALRLRGIDVVTAFEDGCNELEDPALLDRASELGRPVVTFDDDFLVEAARRQSYGVEFIGVIFARPLQVSIGRLIEELELITTACDLQDLAG